MNNELLTKEEKIIEQINSSQNEINPEANEELEGQQKSDFESASSSKSEQKDKDINSEFQDTNSAALEQNIEENQENLSGVDAQEITAKREEDKSEEDKSEEEEEEEEVECFRRTEGEGLKNNPEIKELLDSLAPNLKEIAEATKKKQEAEEIIEVAKEDIRTANNTIDNQTALSRLTMLKIISLIASKLYLLCEQAVPKIRKNQFATYLKDNYFKEEFPALVNVDNELKFYAKAAICSQDMNWSGEDWNCFIEVTQPWSSKVIESLFTKFPKDRVLFFTVLNSFKDSIPSVEEIEKYKQEVAPTKVNPDIEVNPKVIDLISKTCKDLPKTRIGKYVTKLENIKKNQGIQTPVVTGGELISELSKIEKEKYQPKLLKLVPKVPTKRKSPLQKQLETEIERNKKLETELEKVKEKNLELQATLENYKQNNKESIADLVEALVIIGNVSGDQKDRVLDTLNKLAEAREAKKNQSSGNNTISENNNRAAA